MSGGPLRPVGGDSRTSVKACYHFPGRWVLKWAVGLASDNKGGPRGGRGTGRDALGLLGGLSVSVSSAESPGTGLGREGEMEL